MTRRLVVSALVFAALACGREGRLGPTPAPQLRTFPVSEEAAIYAAVIGKTKGASQAWYVYVPRTIEGPEPLRLSDEVRDEIRRIVRGQISLEFVESTDGLIGPPEQGSVVRRNGTIVTLGQIVTIDEDTVHVHVTHYRANLSGGGMTWVLDRREGTWVVTGTTGPVVIS